MRISPRSPLVASLSLLGILVGGAGIVTAMPVAAASETFVVRSLGDKPDSDPGDGVCATAGSGSAARRCTLRAAIMEANATPGQDRVRFAIENGTSGWKTIKPASALPVISAPLVIDGSTQAGATDNTSATGTNARMRVILVGSQAGNAAGLQASAQVTIRGLVIDRFARGIQLSEGSDGSRVLGTFVGTDRTGRQARGNHGSGILVNAADVHIGSAARADRNLVSGNDSAGISLGIAAQRATVQGNLIGTRSDGSSPLGNGADGVFVTGSRDHLIGGEAAGEGNIIGWNGGDGVSLLAIDSLDLVPRSVRILGNSISHDDRLGIDLGADGSTANDPVPDTDGGPNRLQNKPRVIGAVAGATRTIITGSLASRRGQAYRIEVFQSATGDPEGRAYLGSLDVTTGADGRASWTFRIRARLAPGTIITATATDIGRAETSEFSPARTVTGS